VRYHIISAALLCLLFQAVVVGQDRDKAKSVPRMQRSTLTWSAIATHSSAELKVSGQIDSLSRSFSEGESLTLNVINEELPPGMYRYRMTFIPNAVGEAKALGQQLRSNRRDLLARRLKLLKEGNYDGAKAMMRRADQARDEMLAQPIGVVTVKNEDFITACGIFEVKPDGSVAAFDLAQLMEKVRERELDEQERGYEAEESTEINNYQP